MSERLPCQTAGCAATILPATALKTGGICMPCHQKKLALEEKTYILLNRKDVDRYAGMTDPVEILQIMHTPRKYNPLENEQPYPISAQELYHQLSDTERNRLESYAITLMDEGSFDQAESILLSLLCFTNAGIERGVDAFFNHGKLYPGILYKEASPAIREKLILQVEQDSANRNHLLLALAWIGDEEVVRWFANWRQAPPQWASTLYVPPEHYAHEAGWELDDNGRKRLLFHPESYHFKGCKEIGEADQAQTAVTALQKDEQKCLWCGSNLTVLFHYDLQHPIVQFMKLSGEALRIPACLYCNCYGTVFMKVGLDGSHSWSEYNTVPEYMPEAEPDEEWAWRSLRLSEQRMGTYEGANWMHEASSTQIGGHPAWVQDAEYAACPCCSETMMFIGQVDMEQAADSEGIYYAFLCRQCLIAGVSYQQS